jgi:type II secretory pathway component PulM
MRVWKEKIVEPLDDLQERARLAWSGLAPREKLILSILGSVFGLLLVIFLLKESVAFFSRHETEMEQNAVAIQEIQGLTERLAKQRLELSLYERLKNRRPSPFSLNNFLESEARKVGVSLQKTAPTKSRAEEGAAEEEWMEIQLATGVSLDMAMKYLALVEEPLGVRIVELTMKPQFTDPSKLDVVAIIAARKDLE